MPHEAAEPRVLSPDSDPKNFRVKSFDAVHHDVTESRRALRLGADYSDNLRHAKFEWHLIRTNGTVVG